MAYLVGYVSKAEREELERRGWDVEPVTQVVHDEGFSFTYAGDPPEGDEAVVVFVDSNLFDIMSGTDWEK